MSISDTVDHVLSELKGLASNYKTQAQNLISAADGLLDQAKFDPPEKIDYDLDTTFSSPQVPSINKQIDFPASINLPSLDALRPILELTDKFSSEPPKLVLPGFNQGPVREWPDFSKKPTAVKPLKIRPPASPSPSFDPPELAQPENPDLDSVHLIPPTIDLPEIPVTPSSLTEIVDPYQRKLNQSLREFTEWRTLLAERYDQGKTLAATICAQLEAILTGARPGVSDTWETATYQQEQHAAFTARYAELDELDLRAGAITGLPAGQRDYAQIKSELKTLQQIMQAAAKTANSRQHQETKHLRWAIDLMGQLGKSADVLMAEVQAWKLQGLTLALEGAQAALEAASQVLTFKEKEVALLLQYNEAQLQRAELSIKSESTKLDVLTAEVEYNKRQSTYNQQQIEIDAAATTFVENSISWFRTQIQFLVTQSEWAKLSYANFESEVLAYKADIRNFQTKVAELKARIKGDLALSDGEIADAKKEIAAMRAEEATAEAWRARITGLTESNQQKLKANKAETKAKMAFLEEIGRAADVSLRWLANALEANANTAIYDFNVDRLEALRELHEKRLQLKTDFLNRVKILNEQAILSDQFRSAAKITSQGSSVLGGISQSAFSGLNGIGVKHLLEEA